MIVPFKTMNRESVYKILRLDFVRVNYLNSIFAKVSDENVKYSVRDGFDGIMICKTIVGHPTAEFYVKNDFDIVYAVAGRATWDIASRETDILRKGMIQLRDKEYGNALIKHIKAEQKKYNERVSYVDIPQVKGLLDRLDERD